MDKIEFLRQLEGLLYDIPEGERQEAIQYYQDYFEDAGLENEGQVIRELGSPERIAMMIKDGVEDTADDYGEFTEKGYEDRRFTEDYMPETFKGQEARGSQQAESGYRSPFGNDFKEDYAEPYEKQRQTYQQKRSFQEEQGYGERTKADYEVAAKASNGPWKVLKWILIILGLVIALPVIFGLGSGVLGILIGLTVAVVMIFLSVFIVNGALIFGGIVMFIAGIFRGMTYLSEGLATAGGGMIMVALGLCMLIFSVWIACKVIPGFFRWVARLCKKPFNRRRQAE